MRWRKEKKTEKNPQDQTTSVSSEALYGLIHTAGIPEAEQIDRALTLKIVWEVLSCLIRWWYCCLWPWISSILWSQSTNVRDNNDGDDNHSFIDYMQCENTSNLPCKTIAMTLGNHHDAYFIDKEGGIKKLFVPGRCSRDKNLRGSNSIVSIQIVLWKVKALMWFEPETWNQWLAPGSTSR